MAEAQRGKEKRRRWHERAEAEKPKVERRKVVVVERA
jgi:hypothetical protein